MKSFECPIEKLRVYSTGIRSLPECFLDPGRWFLSAALHMLFPSAGMLFPSLYLDNSSSSTGLKETSLPQEALPNPSRELALMLSLTVDGYYCCFPAGVADAVGPREPCPPCFLLDTKSSQCLAHDKGTKKREQGRKDGKKVGCHICALKTLGSCGEHGLKQVSLETGLIGRRLWSSQWEMCLWLFGVEFSPPQVPRSW